MATFTTIAQIQAHQWVGCHAFDSAAFSAIDRFVLDPSNSIADRAAASRLAAQVGMGLTLSDCPELALPDAELVAIYVTEMG